MSWAGLAGNQAVSFDDAWDAINNGVLTLIAGHSLATGAQLITQGQCFDNINILDEPSSSWQGSQQWATKAILEARASLPPYYLSVADGPYSTFGRAIRGYLKDVSGNPVTISVQVTFYFYYSINSVDSGVMSAAITAGNSEVVITTYDTRFDTFDYAGMSFSNPPNPTITPDNHPFRYS